MISTRSSIGQALVPDLYCAGRNLTPPPGNAGFSRQRCGSAVELPRERGVPFQNPRQSSQRSKVTPYSPGEVLKFRRQRMNPSSFLKRAFKFRSSDGCLARWDNPSWSIMDPGKAVNERGINQRSQNNKDHGDEQGASHYDAGKQHHTKRSYRARKLSMPATAIKNDKSHQRWNERINQQFCPPHVEP